MPGTPVDEYGNPRRWRASAVMGGTPGRGAEPRDLPGDANGDGVFNSTDLVLVFRAGEYDDGADDNSRFDEGDWNGDGDFDSADLVYAFQSGNYSLGLQAYRLPIPGDLLADIARDVHREDQKPTGDGPSFVGDEIFIEYGIA